MLILVSALTPWLATYPAMHGIVVGLFFFLVRCVSPGPGEGFDQTAGELIELFLRIVQKKLPFYFTPA